MPNVRRTARARRRVGASPSRPSLPGAAAGAAVPAEAASEIGVTAKTINIAVIADVDNSLAPNAFKPIVDGAEAGVKFVNANGGVAGRTLKMDFIDSHLNPNDTRNAIITACGQDLAMVGTATALFTGLDDLTGCKDQAGQATGLPDIGSIVLGTPQACAPVSFPVIPSMIDCSTVGKNPQTYRTNQGVFKYLSKQHKGDLHGPVHQEQRLARCGAVDRLARERGHQRRHRRHEHAVVVELVTAERVHARGQPDEAGRRELVGQRPHHAGRGAAASGGRAPGRRQRLGRLAVHQRLLRREGDGRRG